MISQKESRHGLKNLRIPLQVSSNRENEIVVDNSHLLILPFISSFVVDPESEEPVEIVAIMHITV